MKLLLFLSSLFLLACWGDYQNLNCGIASICGFILCAWNPSDGPESAEDMEWDTHTEGAI